VDSFDPGREEERNPEEGADGVRATVGRFWWPVLSSGSESLRKDEPVLQKAGDDAGYKPRSALGNKERKVGVA
jgi:hypothetical protein